MQMKAEICAEVHAKVAYTVRIMLNQLGEEIKSSLSAAVASSAAGEASATVDVCSCRDARKCRVCLEKRTALRVSNHIMKQEEKRIAKMLYKENKMAYKESKRLRKNKYLKSSGTESETDKKPVKIQSSCCRAPPIPPRKVSPPDVVQPVTVETKPSNSSSSHTVITFFEEPKIQNSSACNLSEGQIKSNNIYESDALLIDLTAKEAKEEPSMSAPSIEVQPIPSDSEFEVVSMPAVDSAGAFVRGIISHLDPNI